MFGAFLSLWVPGVGVGMRVARVDAACLLAGAHLVLRTLELCLLKLRSVSRAVFRFKYF